MLVLNNPLPEDLLAGSFSCSRTNLSVERGMGPIAKPFAKHPTLCRLNAAIAPSCAFPFRQSLATEFPLQLNHQPLCP